MGGAAHLEREVNLDQAFERGASLAIRQGREHPPTISQYAASDNLPDPKGSNKKNTAWFGDSGLKSNPGQMARPPFKTNIIGRGTKWL